MYSDVLIRQPISKGKFTKTWVLEILRSAYDLNTEEAYDTVTTETMANLLDLYKTPSAGNELAASGGVQQYLIRQQKQDSGIVQPIKGHGSSSTTFHNLPDSVQLEIFSYLNSKELCNACLVCSHWAVLATDNLLWQRRLKIDASKWRTISHTTNPDMFSECQSDLQAKEIYLRCSPDVCDFMKGRNNGIHNLAYYIRSFLPRKSPRIVMFGPGMETATSGIVRKILDDKLGTFTTTGMFPSQTRGLGSGFSIKIQNRQVFKYIPLYSNTKEQRLANTGQNRLRRSRFFQANNRDGAEEETAVETFEITTDMKDFFRTLDGYIFVVDASLDEMNSVGCAKSELFSMINDNWCNPQAPLIVLSCTTAESVPRLPNINLVRQLGLGLLNRPWQIHTTYVEDLKDCIPALDWMIERCQR